MALRMTVTKTGAAFVYETDEMTTTVNISPDDDEPTIMSKLGKLTDFIRSQQPHEYKPTAAPGWERPAQPDQPPRASWVTTHADAVTLNKPAPGPFGSLAESLAQANAIGWELIPEGE